MTKELQEKMARAAETAAAFLAADGPERRAARRALIRDADPAAAAELARFRALVERAKEGEREALVALPGEAKRLLDSAGDGLRQHLEVVG